MSIELTHVVLAGLFLAVWVVCSLPARHPGHTPERRPSLSDWDGGF